MPDKNIEKIAKEYAKELLKNGISFENIYLYGSYATGKAKKNSDIDLAIVVNKIDGGKNYLDKKKRLWQITIKVDSRIEPILLEKADFKKTSATILANEIKKTGIKIL